MPVMDGFEFVEKAQSLLKGESNPDPCVFVALSANFMSFTKDKCLKKGFDMFLGKPFTISELTTCLQDCVLKLNKNAMR